MQVDPRRHSRATSALPRPRLLGRLARLLLGAGIASMLFLTSPAELADPDGLFWFLALLAFLSLPGFVDVLLGLQWRRKSQLFILLLGAVAAGLNLALYGQVWIPLLAWLVYGVIVIVLGVQALSFLLAALLRTPGCEWRALPHLLALLQGGEVDVEPCSIYLHKLDAWEARRR